VVASTTSPLASLKEMSSEKVRGVTARYPVESLYLLTDLDAGLNEFVVPPKSKIDIWESADVESFIDAGT
jgi:hypothetical protein